MKYLIKKYVNEYLWRLFFCTLEGSTFDFVDQTETEIDQICFTAEIKSILLDDGQISAAHSDSVKLPQRCHLTWNGGNRVVAQIKVTDRVGARRWGEESVDDFANLGVIDVTSETVE